MFLDLVFLFVEYLNSLEMVIECSPNPLLCFFCKFFIFLLLISIKPTLSTMDKKRNQNRNQLRKYQTPSRLFTKNLFLSLHWVHFLIAYVPHRLPIISHRVPILFHFFCFFFFFFIFIIIVCS